MSFAIRVENLGKRYQLGMTHAGSIRELVNRTVGKLMGRRPEPLPHEAVQQIGGRTDVEEDGSFWALKDVSFEVKPGEVVGIIGRNGSGKSTLLKIMSQVTAPTTGRVELHGRVASLLEVGTGFHQELSGRENVYLNGAILGMTKGEIKRKFDEIVAFAEIEKFIDTPVKRYSSGMYVRLAFAVAAHLEPEILLIDEVLAVGDAEFQAKCLGKMGEVAHQGRTVLFVSHNMGAIERLCRKAVFLESGKLAIYGLCQQAIRAYLPSEPHLEWRRTKDVVDRPFFRRVWLCDDTGAPCSQPTSGGQFGVGFEFVVPYPSPGLMLGMALIDETGAFLFTSLSEDDGKPCPNQQGVYQARMLFPPEMFCPAKFSLNCWLANLQEAFDLHEAVLSFTVQETASLKNRLQVKRYGDIHVPCTWIVLNQIPDEHTTPSYAKA